jgi:hypothetical protein
MSNIKRSWGKSELKFCPKNKKVWQYKYDTNKNEYHIIIHNDMPSYGLARKEIPNESN